jgi:TonB family protein
MNLPIPRWTTLLLVLLVPLPAAAQQKQAPAEPAPTLASPPKLLRLVPAALPQDTAFPADEVQVLLSIQVEADGRVSSVSVKQGAGEPFDAAALAAARQFVFQPALLSTGEPVPVNVSFRMRIRRPPPKDQPAPPRPARYTGRLLERGTRVPLSGVEVTALRGKDQLGAAVTDDAGRFTLDLPPGKSDLKALAPGHQKLELELELKPGEKREETFYLETTDRGFVTVVESTTVSREVTKQVLPKELVDKIPGTAGDTLKAVQILPGVSRSAFDSGLLILRGAAPGDSQIFVEGQRIPLLYHFGGLRSTFNAVFLESIEFLPGNFGPDYGRATGGVVNVRVRDPASDMFRGVIDINFYDASVALEGPVGGNWSLGGAFRRSYIDAILPAVLPEDAPLSFDTLPRFYDYQLLSTWKPDANRRLKLIFYGSMDKLTGVFDRPQGDPTIRGEFQGRVMFHNLFAGYSHRFNPRLQQESSVQVGIQEISTTVGPELFFDLRTIRASARSTWSYELNRLVTLRGGLDLELEWVDIALNSPLRTIEGENPPPLSTQELFGLESQATLVKPATFVEAALNPYDPLLILLSLRLDYYSANSALSLDPRVVVRYRFPTETTVKAGFGSYSQPPQADQTDPDLGNPELMPLNSMHASLGVEQRLFEMLDVELTGFYKWLDNQVVRNPAFFYFPTAVPYVSSGSGRIFGLELLVRANLFDRFTGWLAYTFQRSFRQDGPGAEERVFDFDQPHILTVVGSYDFGRGWSAGLRFRLISGTPYTPVTDSIYDANSDTYVPIFGETNSERVALFHQLDLRVDKEWTFETWRLGLYLDIQNVYNQRNEEGRMFSFDYRQSAPVSGAPILPILGVRGTW